MLKSICLDSGQFHGGRKAAYRRKLSVLDSSGKLDVFEIRTVAFPGALSRSWTHPFA